MDPKWSKLFQKGLNGSKWDNWVLIGPKWFKWVPRGPKYGSNIIMNSIGWPLNPGLLGLVLLIGPTISLTIPFGLCISKVVELAGVGSVINGDTPSSLTITHEFLLNFFKIFIRITLFCL